MENKLWSPWIRGFEAFLLLERSLSANTIEAYKRDLGKLAEFLHLQDRKVPPSEIQTEDLFQFLMSLNELGLSAPSQARLISALKTFYKYLLLEGGVQNDPTALLEGPRLTRAIPSVLSYEEIQAMLATIDLSTPLGLRNRAILEVLYACGLRVSELCDLRLSNLFLDIEFIRIIGKGNKERIIPIGADAIKHLGFYLSSVRHQMPNIQKGHENYVFLNRRGARLSRVMVFLIVKEAATAAEIAQEVSPHTFRHSFATHLLEGGAGLKAIQDMLGHESILTTEIYTHLDTDYLRETVLRYHPRNRGGG